MPVLYAYKNCDTCRKASKWLQQHDISHETKAIRDTPPTLEELKIALKSQNGDLRKLFNTSGVDYRQLGMKDKLPGLSEDEALTLLSQNGNLVKRPLLLADDFVLIGFNESAWTTAFA
ncbi:arsenate reductase family protein [Luteolibacter pohnpeiensis]|uniref:Arsenate reductase family protein n=1 Tax=Luteolibacter pohnpeiensis TaxID=454153 RepID=A0A934S200_9BACT|nr:arsenate reductase family protein [Luteolibacter pohnpeiensis]MBK1881740.1 arsenate reductase family protein [Luteolibacter pohnpeiensis]